MSSALCEPASGVLISLNTTSTLALCSECSSDPGADGGASFLDLSIDAGPFTDVSLLNASWLETSSSSESIQHPDMKRVSREEFIAYQLRHRAVGPSEGGSAGKPSAPMTDSAKRKMGRYLNQVNYPEGGQEVANVYATLFKAIDKAGKTSNKDSTGGGLKSMMGMVSRRHDWCNLVLTPSCLYVLPHR